jgi:hypothetical protein
MPAGERGEDFDASLSGEWEINPTLLHLLKTDYQVTARSTVLTWSLTGRREPANRRRSLT